MLKKIMTIGLLLLAGLFLLPGEKVQAHNNDVPTAVNKHKAVVVDVRGTSVAYRKNVKSAMGKWNKVNNSFNSRGVRFVLSSNTRMRTTLKVRTVRDCKNEYTGWYNSKSSPREIWLNTCILNKYNYSSYRITGVMSHEFGHTIDFAHVPSSMKDSSIMVSPSNSARTNGPMQHDRSDFRKRWVR